LLEYWRNSQFQQDVATKSNVVRSALHAIASEYAEHNWDVRGKGLVWGLDVGCGELASAISKAAFHRGLIVETCGAHDQVVKLLPPLTILESELNQGLQILSDSIEEVVLGTHAKSCSTVNPGVDASNNANVVTSLPITFEATQVLI
jgi:diaminobutyrate-2-oxoglutarate transaminase